MSSSFVAGGNIAPSRFVSISGDRTVVQSGSGDTTVIGISQLGTHLPPLLSLNDGYAAVANENVRVYTKDDSEAWLQLYSACTAGDLLKPASDGTGKGVTSTSDADFYGARALTGGATDQIIKVKIQPGFHTQ